MYISMEMEFERRFSTNKYLKMARIFDEDSGEGDESATTKEVTVKTEIKQELFDEDTNFAISEEAFANIHIKKEVLEELTSPMKTDIYDNSDSNSRKSFKSAKLTTYKKRDSPYKTPVERPSSSRVTHPNFDESNKLGEKKKISHKEFETDPLILSRRQKQIDYGKNTVGYDEYCQRVPKNHRKSDDPQTPNKYLKYSRRGWDGLIKQWRLKLHRYDPDAS